MKNGVTTNINLCNIVDNCETLTSILLLILLTNQLVYTDEDGMTNNLSHIDALSFCGYLMITLNTSVQTIATHTSGDGTVVAIEETVTTLVDNLDGTFTYISEDGTSTTYDETTTSVAL